ncbi:hypothetical protein QRO11_15480 [Paracidovorax citrulli]|uniref:hypothetical protein n=1 Tax=Paracidovorax citrulli TaxID=80869 RepID=UPI0008860F3C|nr:hypothetical protein [Paracidovorax citrulli]UMT87771.1 hypothetical protein FRC90_06595 [Paracidovorax citrulli]WIY33350.1 hypothetical protein QRO11_15480 [Paracidovorax citrulli]SDL32034.1 hypothetical protein SAMN04489709_13931 [Paracidovorax citrulli]
MTRARTTAFIFRDADYFAAHLNDGGVRIGIVGGVCYDIPVGHAHHARAAEANTRAAVEDLHDELTSATA